MEQPVKKRKGNLPEGPGPGRPKGTPNKLTVEFRDTVRQLLERNSDNVSVWLEQVAMDDPGKALDLLAKLAEFAAPKLARTEVTGADGGPQKMEIAWKPSE